MSNLMYKHRNLNERKYETGRNRKKRPKTFKSKEAAKRYAEKHKIKDYELKNLRFSEEKPKYRIVEKK